MGSRFLLKAALTAAAVLSLAACDAVPRYRAAKGVRDFLAAIQKNDHRAFDAHVDRAKLKDDVRRQLAASADGADEDIGRVIGGPAVDDVMNRMISPESFRIVWMRSGVSIRRAPNALEIAPLLRMLGEDRACLRNPRRGSPCILTFEDENGVWKLVGVNAGLSGDESPAKA
jgi:hypothetical protein